MYGHGSGAWIRTTTTCTLAPSLSFRHHPPLPLPQLSPIAARQRIDVPRAAFQDGSFFSKILPPAGSITAQLEMHRLPLVVGVYPVHCAAQRRQVAISGSRLPRDDVSPSGERGVFPEIWPPAGSITAQLEMHRLLLVAGVYPLPLRRAAAPSTNVMFGIAPRRHIAVRRPRVFRCRQRRQLMISRSISPRDDISPSAEQGFFPEFSFRRRAANPTLTCMEASYSLPRRYLRLLTTNNFQARDRAETMYRRPPSSLFPW
ncbi:hypothetical protein C8R43DRAFT_1228827 [Mycena crocata]|nr:hypothetical protein C8R43DRAFT_1228827 [Mycena crocata]